MISEWYREPISTLEKTLRVPYFIKHSTLLFLSRLLPIWATWSIGLTLLSKNFLVSILLGFVFTFIVEMIIVRKWLLTKIIPRHMQNLKEVKDKYSQMGNLSAERLSLEVEKCIDLSAWGIVNIAYAAPQSWGWEIIFKLIFPFLVKTASIKPTDLLIGFKNKTVESDQFLWKVANENNSKRQQSMLQKYMELYGSRTDDVDLAKPTLREKTATIQSLINLYKSIVSPQERQKNIKKLREKATNLSLVNLRIPKRYFLSFLSLVQKNVQLREDRRFYEFVMDYYIRQMILRLNKILNLDNGIIFSTPWDEIKKAVHH